MKGQGTVRKEVARALTLGLKGLPALNVKKYIYSFVKPRPNSGLSGTI